MQLANQSMSRSEILYLILVTLFCVIVIVSNLITIKLVHLPWTNGLALPCGLLIYPLTFLVSDLITELFGINRAKFMIYLGFTMGLLTHAIIRLSIHLPPHEQWILSHETFISTNSHSYQLAYESIFGLNGIALFSSIAAYSVTQILDIRLFSFLKELTHGRFLWLRNCGSTLTSQLVDTLIVNILFLYCGLKLDLITVVSICMISYAYKILFTLTNAPLFYLLVFLSKNFLGKEQDPAPQKSICTVESTP